jgi:hydrogenase nickel incorporation protein HypB
VPLPDIDLLFIENVGNLVCPAEFDLGGHLAVVVASTPEGHDRLNTLACSRRPMWCC